MPVTGLGNRLREYRGGVSPRIRIGRDLIPWRSGIEKPRRALPAAP
jgi:hypothetical protein